MSLECDQDALADGLAAGDDSTGLAGLDTVVGTGAMVGVVEVDDELHAPTNSAAATISMARTALMTGSPRAWGFPSTLGPPRSDERFRIGPEPCRTI